MTHGRLGIGIQGLNQALRRSFNLPDSDGALVGTVEKDSPAEKAGFKTGDVIRKIDSVAITDSTDVTSRIGNMAPGTKVSIEVWREGKPVDTDGDDRNVRRHRKGRAVPARRHRAAASSASPCGR